MDRALSARGPAAGLAGARRCSHLAAIAAAMLVVAACSDQVVDPLSANGSAETKRIPKWKEGRITTVRATSNPLAGVAFYLDPASDARKQADEWLFSRPEDAAQLEKIATQPQAKWLGAWLSDPSTEISKTLIAASQQNAVAVLVAYNITRLNCGSSGAQSADAYRTWITRFASAIGDSRAVVILEPDALPAMGCLSSALRQERYELLGYAVRTLKAQLGVTLYVDAGHAAWQSAAEMARRLTLAGVADADGFSLNVSNFVSTEANTSYGADLSSRVGGKHFVIDTGRNGLGPTADYQWCNPAGRALGVAPGTLTSHRALDAYLWIKPPGESDGTCNGGPAAGSWWAEYALGLAQRS
jgi:endoglucanase